MECYSASKRNKLETVLARWMNLESVIESEVREKNKCHILMHIYGNQKMVLMNLSEGQRERLRHREWTYTQQGQESVELIKRTAFKYIHYCMNNS